MKILLLTAAFFGTTLATSYEGYQVLRTSPLTSDQANLMRQLQADEVHYDFWKDANVNMPAEVMASPEHLKDLKAFMDAYNIEYTTKIEDVAKLIELSQQPSDSRKVDSEKSPRYSLDWDSYGTHDQFNEFIDEMAANNDFAETASIGKSFEGRDIKVLKINKAPADAPVVFIEAGIHAREWIAPAVATYTVKELLENYDAHPEYVDKINWHIIPCANPDGYEYSQTAGNRMWRKNRGENAGSSCKGTDLNRNWEYKWGESGISHNQCSDVYLGDKAFSEVESQNIRDYFNGLSKKPDVAVCFHSAAELWLYPYGYAYDQYPDNVNEIKSVAQDAVDALNAVNGENFQIMNAADLYPAAGASDDWYASKNTRFVYTPELRDNGYGFMLPPNLIKPSGEEVWAAWEVILNKIME